MQKTTKILLGLTFMLILSFYIDKFILDLIEYLRIESLNKFFIFFSKYFNYYFLAVIITLIPLFKNQKLKNLIALWTSFLAAGLLVFILKIIIQRPRPLINLIETSSFSFPSGHTTIMFALLPIFYSNFKEYKYTWLTISLLVALSRIYLGVHHLSDIIGGMLIGILVGVNIIKLFNNKN